MNCLNTWPSLAAASPLFNQPASSSQPTFNVLTSKEQSVLDHVGVVLIQSLCLVEEAQRVLRLSLDEFSLPKFYLLFGISKVKSAAVTAFRSSYRTPADTK